MSEVRSIEVRTSVVVFSLDVSKSSDFRLTLEPTNVVVWCFQVDRQRTKGQTSNLVDACQAGEK